MQFWDNIINVATIGTDKKTLGAEELSADLIEAGSLVNGNTAIDKEDKFLQLAALAFNYRQCGILPVLKEEVELALAPPEEKNYCNPEAHQTLTDILEAENYSLFELWLEGCIYKQQIVTVDLVPALLATGIQQKKLQPLIAAACGRRGEWLARFNDSWNYSSGQSEEQAWQTGTPEQRKILLKQLRLQDPSKAREWLQLTWSEEDANTKTAFLELLESTISGVDISFLENLAGEKSKKVKDEALRLLKRIPTSSIVEKYQMILRQAVTHKKEKALLGMVNKSTLQFSLPAIEDTVYKSGIEKLSSKKEITDEEYILSQLIGSVPPSFWESHFSESPEQIINLFQKSPVGKKMIPALVTAISQFRDERWAIFFMQHSEVFYIDIIPLLPVKQQEYYSIKYFDGHPESILNYALYRQTEWGHEFCQSILKYTVKNVYQYNRSFYGQYINLIPASIIPELPKFMPAEEHLQSQWTNNSAYINKLLILKTQIQKAFNA